MVVSMLVVTVAVCGSVTVGSECQYVRVSVCDSASVTESVCGSVSVGSVSVNV